MKMNLASYQIALQFPDGEKDATIKEIQDWYIKEILEELEYNCREKEENEALYQSILAELKDFSYD